MNNNCRACKHDKNLHINNNCTFEKCHCGYLLIDDGTNEIKNKNFEVDLNNWHNRPKFNPRDKKKDRTVNKKPSYEE